MEVKMSPTMKKYTKIITTFLCAFLLWNCSHHSTDSSVVSGESEMANVALRLQYITPPLLDSLVLDCYGTDTLHLVHSADKPQFNMDLFPSDNWKFNAKIYANGALMQMGELETKLSAGASTNLTIQMHPIVGFVVVEVPIGLKNENGIASGLMTLESGKDCYEIPMEETTGGFIFRSGMLKLGSEYKVQIALLDSAGNEIYKLSDKFLLTEDSPVPNLTLNSLRSKVALSIEAAEERYLEITVPIKAGFRSPKRDDLLITEYFSAPDSKDSSQYEFVEIYNGSLDTLILDDCTLGILSSSSMRQIPLTVSEIVPRQVLVLGDPTSEKTDPLHIHTDGWVPLGNAKGCITLRCNGETLDSLYYASEPDSLHTNVVPSAGNKTGISGQLNIDQWKNRADSSAWSLEKPTPGKIN